MKMPQKRSCPYDLQYAAECFKVEAGMAEEIRRIILKVFEEEQTSNMGDLVRKRCKTDFASLSNSSLPTHSPPTHSSSIQESGARGMDKGAQRSLSFSPSTSDDSGFQSSTEESDSGSDPSKTSRKRKGQPEPVSPTSSEESQSEREQRPRKTRNRNLNSAKLWEWMLYLLLNPKVYGHIVQWYDFEAGIFVIRDRVELAKVYNTYKATVPCKCRTKDEQVGIKYESITRALRHCYSKNVIQQFPRKNKYVFGPNATRWREGVTRENAIRSINNWDNNWQANNKAFPTF